MLNFDYHNATRIVFGRDTHREIGALVKPHARKALLHYGGGSIRKSGVHDAVTASLRDAGVPFVELGGVVPNPRLSLVREGVELARREGVDLVLAVGGGSVIDSAKAIAMGVFLDDDPWNRFEDQRPIAKALPVACILTIPAAGSESSVNTVISNEEKRIKRGYASPLLRPLMGVVNPELFFTLPPDQIANGVADMASHIFERYFTPTPATELTDSLCEATLRTIFANAPRVLADPGDYDAWCQIGFGGTLAHNNLLGLGRQQDWACHAMEHELSAFYDVPHGAGLAVVTPAWMRYVHGGHPGLFAQFAANVLGVPADFRAAGAVAREGIDRLAAFYRRLGLPGTLGELGIGQERFEDMARRATRVAFGPEQPIGGLRRLDWRDVLEIYRLAR